MSTKRASFGAHLEVGQGGHFLGAAHTLERFRDCFHRPLRATTKSYERWTRDGALDAAARADLLWHEALERYGEPPNGRRRPAALTDFVAGRRRELGD